ncbi:SDR family oxidoreductase [Candidatus Woesearchaeota archaeon]|jgi:dTDP-4-dehydrorhamnose reductase|nr:SDR family oxidoreductase [Candidatus Woesearchaeota archaeon]
MRIGVTGASGMLGTALIDELTNKHEVFATSRRKGLEKDGVQWECFDLTNSQHLNQWLVNVAPDVVVHCAAMVDVDRCEDDVDFATKLHIGTTKIMANYLDCNNKKLIYISTDSVFDGKKNRPYVELDKVNPLNIYAKTKLLGEQPVLLMEDGLVLRTNIIGWGRSGNISFAEWMLKGLVESKPLTLFDDVIFSPLNVSDLSVIITQTIDSGISGLYHCASKDYISKYDFGIKMAEVFNLSISNIKKISVEDMNFKANRPKNMALNSNKLSSILVQDLPIVIDAIKLMKDQYDNGWVSRIKSI